MRVSLALAALLLALAPLPLQSGTKKINGQLVDSGTFGIYVSGKRVAAETFEIIQSPDMSVAKSDLRLEDGGKVVQTSELQMSPNGDLRRYQWVEKDKGQAVVEPKNDFLIEKITATDATKSVEQPFILPVSTMVLDDYFFSHRELLLWRYLASNCQPKQGEQGCTLNSAQYGVLVPRQRSSQLVSIEYLGQQKVNIKGSDRDLSKFVMHVDGVDWQLWLDPQYKVQRIVIESESTEVVRE